MSSFSTLYLVSYHEAVYGCVYTRVYAGVDYAVRFQQEFSC
jgi:hypothetical protein